MAGNMLNRVVLDSFTGNYIPGRCLLSQLGFSGYGDIYRDIQDEQDNLNTNRPLLILPALDAFPGLILFIPVYSLFIGFLTSFLSLAEQFLWKIDY